MKKNVLHNLSEFSGKSSALFRALLKAATGKDRRRRHEDEHFLQVLISAIPVPVFYKDKQGVYLGCNQAFLDFIGLTREQIIGKTVYDVAPRALAETYEKKDQELFGHSGTQVYEHSVRHADGTIHNVIFHKATYAGIDGTAGLIGVMLDITERKQLEAKLARSEGHLRTIIDTEPECVKLIGSDGTLLEMNPAGLAMIEADSLAQVAGKQISSLIAPEYRTAFEALNRRTFRGESGTLEFEIIGLKGSRRWLETHTAALRNDQGKIFALLGLTRDITERKRAEEALRANEEKFRQVVESAKDAITVFDAETRRYIEVNKAAETIYGYSREEWLNMRVDDIALDTAEVRASIHTIAATGKPVYIPLRNHRKKDGTVFPVEISSSVFTANGKKFICGVIHDITERLKSEEVIRRNYDTQTAINWILHISLENISLESILRQALDVILSIPWLSLESKGSIFLVDERDPSRLVLKAQRGLPEDLSAACAIVPFGTCLCGRAAARREVQYAASVDSRHDVQYEGMTPHGHYCVPIQQAQNVLGVINMYITENHARDDREIEFLQAIANALAGIIRRKHDEQGRHVSEERYRTLAEAAHDVIFIVDRAGCVQYANNFAAALFGRTPQELTGRSIDELFMPEMSERMRSSIETVLMTGEAVYRESPIAYPGRTLWMGTRLVPLRNEARTIYAVLGIARDITDRRLAEEERELLINDLRNALDTVSRAHKDWRDTFDSITDLIAIVDKSGVILKANRPFAAYYGLQPQEVIQRTCSALTGSGDARIFTEAAGRTDALSAPISEEVVDIRTGKIYRVSSFPYRGPAGETVGTILVARDVTEEKEQEMRLIMSERLAALGQMASGIAHEINNPLASIAGCSEGMLSRVRKGQSDPVLFERYLNIIQEEVFRCKNITTAMLSFVRKTTYEQKALNVNEMLDKTVEIISFQGRLKKVDIVRRYGPSSLRVHGNEGELRQVFLTVITNALDAMENLGVVTIETGTSDGSAHISISDSGPGIPAENLEKIFDPFFTTKADKGGTGLGLSIARKIVVNHHGTMRALSGPGRGSTFFIVLPL